MQLTRKSLLAAFFTAAAACGPDSSSDWVIGIYSSETEGGRGQFASVTHYDIRADGTAVFSKVYPEIPEEITSTRNWVRRDEHTIDILFSDAGEGGIEAWRVTPGENCDVRIHYISRGKVGIETGLYWGAVCLERLPGLCPSGSECDSTKKVWCDGSPPPCDE